MISVGRAACRRHSSLALIPTWCFTQRNGPGRKRLVVLLGGVATAKSRAFSHRKEFWRNLQGRNPLKGCDAANGAEVDYEAVTGRIGMRGHSAY